MDGTAIEAKGIVLPTELDGSRLRVGIVHTRWNAQVVDALVQGAESQLATHGVSEVIKKDVPGSYELPFAAKWMVETYKVDAVIAIGTLIKGSTMHFEYICEACSSGLMRVGLDSGVPVIFGVLTCLTIEQSHERAGLTEGGHNHGLDWGSAAVEMALLGKPGTPGVLRFKPSVGDAAAH